MKYIKQIFLFFIILNVVTTYSQKVNNITFKQEQSMIIVYYDLETKTPCKINMYVSTNGGTLWEGPLKKVIGDVGDKITSGNHSITWNVLDEVDELRGDKIMFQVRASGEYIETVVIGNQEWTKRNLNVSKYRNGDIIPEVKDPKKWSKLTTGAWCYYNNDIENGEIYGKLYNWYAVSDPRGLAPEGFHIPNNDEWATITNFLGGEGIAGCKMKENGYYHWNEPNVGANDSSGFKGLAGGYRYKNGILTDGMGYFGYWWSSNNYEYDQAISHVLYTNYKIIGINKDNKNCGFSVRCIKD